MAESFISKRVIFPRGKQREFLLKMKKALNLSYIELAQLLKISDRTLTDWKREKFSISLKAIKTLSRKTKRKIPKNIEIKDPFWYVNKGAKVGGLVVYKKYGRIGGDPEHRKKKWYEWWECEGKYKHHPIINTPLPIKKPKKSEDLAEFIGIVLGDGGITQYQVIISFHSVDEKEYSKFVASLIKRLFDVPIGIHYDKNDLEFDLVISRRELVRFCTEKLGLKKGNKIKQQVDIPEWIKQNKSYLTACVRGLMDTDGCVFTHRYKVNGKLYSYKKLSFTSYSKPLRQAVFNILKDNGLNPRLAQRKDVRLDSIEDMQRYFRVFGSHNPKHLKRYFQ